MDKVQKPRNSKRVLLFSSVLDISLVTAPGSSTLKAPMFPFNQDRS